jgi:hypothetical protein
VDGIRRWFKIPMLIFRGTQPAASRLCHRASILSRSVVLGCEICWGGRNTHRPAHLRNWASCASWTSQRPAACSDVGGPEGSAFSRRLELRQPGWVVVGIERSCHVWMAPANPVGIILAELQRPLPHRLMADPNPAGGEHPETEQKPKVQPHDMADDLGWEPMTGVARMARRFHPSPMPRPGHPWLMRRCPRDLY